MDTMKEASSRNLIFLGIARAGVFPAVETDNDSERVGGASMWRTGALSGHGFRCVQTWLGRLGESQHEDRLRPGPPRRGTLALALCSAAALAPRAEAHHAFATEFDATSKAGERRRHARLVAEPAHSLRRHDEDAGRLDAGVGAAAARQPADLPQRELDRADRPGRLPVSASGNLGREGAKKLYATCITLDSGPEKGRQLGRCATRGHRDAGHRRSERRLHRAREELPREHHGLLGQPLQVPCHGRRLRAETDADDGPKHARSTTAASTATTRCCDVCPRVCRGSSARRIRCRSSTPARTI